MKPVSAAKQILGDDENVTLMESTPLLFMHLSLLAIPFVGFSWVAFWACVITYFLRVFALTAGFHRYFSHRAFKTSRFFGFILGFLGTSSAQLGPIWWASHHRHHHEHSDGPEDIHSPSMRGFFWAHIGWLLCSKYSRPREERVGDLLKLPEIKFLDRFYVLPPLVLGFTLFGIGKWLSVAYPQLGTSGWQMAVWGFFVSTVLVYHVTFMVNSVTHIVGNKRFKTRDESRNSFWVAFVTMGEGWHNNHHRFPVSARQGLYWWEIDVTYYVLKFLSLFRIVWDLKVYPHAIFEEAVASRAQSA